LNFKSGDPDPNAMWNNQQSSVKNKKKETN